MIDVIAPLLISIAGGVGLGGGWMYVVHRVRRRLTATEDERLATAALDEVQVLETRVAALTERLARLEQEALTVPRETELPRLGSSEPTERD